MAVLILIFGTRRRAHADRYLPDIKHSRDQRGFSYTGLPADDMAAASSRSTSGRCQQRQ